MRVLAPIVVVVALVRPVHAEPQGSIALLPLDADPKLEIYSQPIAKEIASTLVTGGIEVVVVGPKMAVPERARLVVDGTIKSGRDNTVTLAIRIRDPREGVTIDTLVVTAPSLDAMDRARDELSAKVLPSIRGRLATMDRPPPKPPVEPHPQVPAPPPLRPMLLAVTTTDNNAAPLRDALQGQIEPWAVRHHHDAKATDMRQIASKAAPKAVAAASADLSLWLEVKDFQVEHDGGLPLATARVHALVADGTHVVFDRVIVTDTIVGEKTLAPEQLIARVAREVISILDPHVRRLVTEWR